MMGTMSMRQPENWLYEIWQKGQSSPCYVMVPNAKDLVKSHLMIAVREEVEVLKEKISELMDKINQLEVENTILKANMPQETLQQLQIQNQLQIAGNAATGNNMIAAAPTPTQQTATAAATAAATTATAAAAAPAAATNATAATVAATASETPEAATAENVIVNTATAASAVPVVTNGAVAATNPAAAATTNGPMS